MIDRGCVNLLRVARVAPKKPPSIRRRSAVWSAERIIIAVGGQAGRLAIPGFELALTYGTCGR
jgi:hypothetical protein